MSIKHSLLILFLCVSLIPNSQAVDAITFLEDNRVYAFDGVQTEVYGLTYSRKLEVRINDGTVNTYMAVERPLVLVENGVAKALFNAIRTDNPTSFNLGRELINPL